MIVYDEECYPNCWLIGAESLSADDFFVWEISQFRDDRGSLYEWLCFMQSNQLPMIGFNNLEYDYPLLHFVMQNIYSVTYAEIYQRNQQIFASQNRRFGETVPQRDRFIAQIDLLKIHHFDNESKRTSLKALEFNMRSASVRDLPFEPGTVLSKLDIDTVLKPYHRHDIKETKRFAKITLPMIKFRQELQNQIKGDVLNFNDTKIGKEYLIQRLGDACWQYNPNTQRREPRGTWREHINIGEIILPYIWFRQPEFNRILTWLRGQVITETKGVFNGVSAFINGLEFVFGTGGIHASVHRRVYRSDENYIVVDVDVESLYPSVAIVNRLAPAHLGEAFVREYSGLKTRRVQYAKDTPENGMLKLGLNGSYGDSNNPHSRGLYDPQFTMSITINGQLLLCMLAEWLMDVPTLELIQLNTDGITYRVHRAFRQLAADICERWQAFTLLKLEFAEYKRMFIRDVNNYVAEAPDGKLKTKGAYFAPKDWQEIQKQKPPAWHQDFSNLVSVRAAVAYMLEGKDIETFIRSHVDPFDFMIRHRIKRDSVLMYAGQQTQRTGRHYVGIRGSELIKITPVKAPFVKGDFKKKQGVSDGQYLLYNITGVWDARIHTKNKSRYDDTRTAIEAGRLVLLCDDVNDFRFDLVDYNFYIEEAKKLVIEG